MEKKLPKPDPISSIPCDEGGKRHIKGCPHKTTTSTVKGEPIWAGTATWTTREADTKTWDKDRWIYEYLISLDRTNEVVGRGRMFWMLAFVVMTIIAVLKS